MGMMFGGWAEEAEEEDKQRDAERLKRALAEVQRQADLKREADEADRPMTLTDDSTDVE